MSKCTCGAQKAGTSPRHADHCETQTDFVIVDGDKTIKLLPITGEDIDKLWNEFVNLPEEEK